MGKRKKLSRKVEMERNTRAARLGTIIIILATIIAVLVMCRPDTEVHEWMIYTTIALPVLGIAVLYPAAVAANKKIEPKETKKPAAKKRTTKKRK